MILEHLGKQPQIDPSATIAPNATICGDVSIGPNTRVLGPHGYVSGSTVEDSVFLATGSAVGNPAEIRPPSQRDVTAAHSSRTMTT